MTTLFDKVSGTYDSFDSNGITDSTASFKVDQFKDWYVTIVNVEFRITSNTATTLSFTNSLGSTGSYEIAIVGRAKLTEIESDFSNTTKINNDLISKKYIQGSEDLNKRVTAYLRSLYGMDTIFFARNGSFVNDFDPFENILNLEIMQQVFAYYLIYLVFKDLSLNQDSYDYFKSEDNFTLFKSTIKDSLSLIQIDFNEDGEASTEEKRNAVSYTRLTR